MNNNSSNKILSEGENNILVEISNNKKFNKYKRNNIDSKKSKLRKNLTKV